LLCSLVEHSNGHRAGKWMSILTSKDESKWLVFCFRKSRANGYDHADIRHVVPCP
jgi:hypothetical protein